MSNASVTNGPAGWWRAAIRLAPTVLAAAALVTLIGVGQRYGWKVPKLSTWTDPEGAAERDWCEEHCVPESVCVECHPDLLPKGKWNGWCRKHGVHECPLCNPGVAQLPGVPKGSTEDWSRAEEALGFVPRPANGSKCRQHLRRL